MTDYEAAIIEETKHYLSGYRFCMDMLKLQLHERKREKNYDEPCCDEDLLCGNEMIWSARMREIELSIDSMRSGREKMILYYRYIRRQSVDHSAEYLGISRRTGYRLYRKGLLMLGTKLLRTGQITLSP